MRWTRLRVLPTLIGVSVLLGIVPVAAAVGTASGTALGGVVTDRTGQPLAGVCVEVAGNGGPYRTVTDQLGQWRVDSVADGAVYVSINECEAAVARYSAQWWPSGPNPYASHGVVMTGADILDADVSLSPASVVSGQVQDPLGAPVDGACIAARVDGEIVGRTRSSNAGTYVLASLPPGTYDIEASDCTDPATLLPAAVGGVSVSGTAPRQLEPLRLRQGGAIIGTVTARHTGAQVSGACVTLWTAEAEVAASLYRGFATSGHDAIGGAFEEPGRFTFSGVEPGTYRVFFGFDFCGSPHDDGYAEVWFRDAVPPDGQPLEVEVVAGEVTDGIDAVLTPVASTELLCPWPPDPGFADVEETSPHARDIACARAVGLMGGDGEDFGPEAIITRGEFASALVAAFARAGSALSADVPDAFADDDHSEHRLAMDQLAATGVMFGTAPGTADASQLLTRGQAATLLIRSHAVMTGERILVGLDLWTDVELSSPHRADLNAAGSASLILGTGGGAVGPDQPVTRAQAASLLTRLVDRTGRDTTG